MAKNNNLKKIAAKGIKETLIPPSATEIRSPQENYDKETPLFSFKWVCDNHCLLSDWQNKELEQLIKKIKMFESLTWIDLKTHNGLNYKPIDNYIYPLPENVPPDSTIHEFKVDAGKRVMGIRDGRIFKFVWFDRQHEVVPESKSKKSRGR